MALLVRKVDKHHKWFKAPAQAFLANNDSPADVLSDLRTDENRISVFMLADDQSNLKRVMRALAVNKHKLETIAYVIFDSRVVADAGIEMIDVPGVTPDAEVNRLHRDLVLTGRKMVELAIGILREGEEVAAILRAEVINLVREGIEAGELPDAYREKLNKK
jgi:hypothetical protein